MTEAQRLKKLEQATKHLQEAARLMEELSATNGCFRWDAKYWATSIRELISCDNGEAGIFPALTNFINKRK